MSLRGCLVKKNADQTAANYSGAVIIDWDTEIYDTDGFHAGGNPSRITIPAAVNGRYGIFTACASVSSVTSGSYAALEVDRGGSAAYIGAAISTRALIGNGQATTAGWLQIQSGPVPLATGEIYEARLHCQDTSITVESESSFGLMVLDRFTWGMRCLAKKNGDQTADFSTPTALAFDGADVYDTHAIHDPSSNNTKLIVPAALNGRYAVVTAFVDVDNNVTSNSQVSCAVRKGGSLVYTGFGGNSYSNGTWAGACAGAATQPIQLATGDEFECLFYCSDTSVTVLGNSTTFGLRVVG